LVTRWGRGVKGVTAHIGRQNKAKDKRSDLDAEMTDEDGEGYTKTKKIEFKKKRWGEKKARTGA